MPQKRQYRQFFVMTLRRTDGIFVALSTRLDLFSLLLLKEAKLFLPGDGSVWAKRATLPLRGIDLFTDRSSWENFYA